MVKWSAAVEYFCNLCNSETKLQATTLWYMSVCSLSVFSFRNYCSCPFHRKKASQFFEFTKMPIYRHSYVFLGPIFFERQIQKLKFSVCPLVPPHKLHVSNCQTCAWANAAGLSALRQPRVGRGVTERGSVRARGQKLLPIWYLGRCVPATSISLPQGIPWDSIKE